MVLAWYFSRTCPRFHWFLKRTEQKCYVGGSENKAKVDMNSVFLHLFLSASDFKFL